MSSELRIRTKVLPGRRVEVASPELNEGDDVEVRIVPAEQVHTGKSSILDFLESLPPGPRSAKTWEEIEEHFKQERESWDR